MHIHPCCVSESFVFGEYVVPASKSTCELCLLKGCTNGSCLLAGFCGGICLLTGQEFWWTLLASRSTAVPCLLAALLVSPA